MSQTTTITPYRETEAEWTRERSAEETRARQAVDRARAERRMARVTPARVTLHTRQIDSLQRTAETLGYRAEGLSTGAADLQQAGRMSLTGTGGDVLVIERTPEGEVVLSSDRGPEAIRHVVREHVLAQAEAHLRAQGMEVRVRRLASGEVQLEGVESRPKGAGGCARIEARVASEGTLHVDVSGLIGPRCDDIALGLARAVGGEHVDVSRKREYFQTPTTGEEHLRA